MKMVFDLLLARWLWHTGVPQVVFGALSVLVGFVGLLFLVLLVLPWAWQISLAGKVFVSLLVLWVALLLLRAFLLGVEFCLILWQDRHSKD